MKVVFKCRKDRKDNQADKKKKIIQWKYSQHPSTIEIFQVIFWPHLIHEDIGDQKTGQNKKQIHSQPAKGKIIGKSKIVKKYNQQDSYAT